MQITEIAFTGYPVTDVARARAFYEGVLKLKTGATFEHEGKSWIEYDIGPGTLAISNMSGEQWKPSSDGPAVALEVAEFDTAIAALRAAGVKFLIEPMDSGVCRMAIVADPDGNSLAIHKRNPPKA
ncbi:MAG: VOC family protein [Opitutaceae bacterium]|nr:VOC family protein [Opitutaceae bacterium]